MSIEGRWVRPGSRKGFQGWGPDRGRFRPFAAAVRLAAGRICRRSLANDVDGWVCGGALTKKAARARRPGKPFRPSARIQVVTKRTRVVIGPVPGSPRPAATANCMAAGEEPGDAGRCRAARLAGGSIPAGGRPGIATSPPSVPCSSSRRAAPGHSSYGRLLLIGGTEDRAGGTELLRTFAELSGGAHARIVLITTASGIPGRSFARYSAAFHRFGVPVVRELRLASREQADDERTLTELIWATGAFFGGGDQSRLGVLVGSRTNRVLRGRSPDNELVIAGTSAGATAMGPAMILSGDGHAGDNDPVGSRVRTGPGLGLLPEVIVDMHFAERRRFPRLLAAVLRQPSHLGVGIDEDTAILVRPGRFDVLGRGAVMAVDARPAAATCPARGQADRACFDVCLHQLHTGDGFDLNRRRPPIAEPFRGEDG